jgi:hypothetical protein
LLQKPDAQIAQLVEQRIENPRVAGSIPALGTTTHPPNLMICCSGDASVIALVAVGSALFQSG